MAYYLKFVQHYPTVQHLADAPEDAVMKDWQGLGYYSRARHLHATAKHIAYERGGKFPETAKELQKLKGIGVYTSAAIASFCFGEVRPVVDGNVARVISRFLAIEDAIDSTAGKKALEESAAALIISESPATYNQAIMEFGALQCTPKSPECDRCPVAGSCAALAKGLVNRLPLKLKKTKQTTRYFDYFIFHHQEHLWINRREKKGIWQHLYDFPLIEHSGFPSREALLQHALFVKWTEGSTYRILQASPAYKHILSHQKLHVRFWEVELSKATKGLDGYRKIAGHTLGNFAVPRLLENYLATQQKARTVEIAFPE